MLENKPKEQEAHKTGMQSIPKDANIKEVNGQYFLIHKVTEWDSLMKLSLKYNVSSKVIKNCNNLVDDQIF
mgnify:CR=1 FL=1